MKKTLIVLLALAFVTPVLAQDVPDGPPPAAVAAHNQVVAFLDLSEDQVIAWQEIYMIHREAEQPVQEAIRILETELQALLDAGDPDAAVAGELVIEIAALRESLREIHSLYHQDFMDLLDEYQTRRLGLIARADRVQRFIPSFKLFELIPRR